MPGKIVDLCRYLHVATQTLKATTAKIDCHSSDRSELISAPSRRSISQRAARGRERVLAQISTRLIFAGQPYRRGMVTILSAAVSIFAFRFRSRASLEFKLIALQHQLVVLRRQRALPRDNAAHRRDTASGPYLRTSVRASGRDVDTDHAVVIAAAATMIAYGDDLPHLIRHLLIGRHCRRDEAK
jgi:hypothetical protein